MSARVTPRQRRAERVRQARALDLLRSYEYGEAPAPDNEDFNEYPEAFQDMIAARFERGIERTKQAALTARFAAAQAEIKRLRQVRDRARRARPLATLGEALRTRGGRPDRGQVH